MLHTSLHIHELSDIMMYLLEHGHVNHCKPVCLSNPWRLVAVVERIQEGDHSLVHREGVLRRVTGAYVSCTQRHAEFDAMMSTAQSRSAFCVAFEKVRKLRDMARVFRFEKHPLWLEKVGAKSGLHRAAVCIIYSTDAYSICQI